MKISRAALALLFSTFLWAQTNGNWADSGHADSHSSEAPSLHSPFLAPAPLS